MTALRRPREGSASAEILTFLIADVRGYTSFTQSRGDEAAAELATAFAEIVREGVEARDGRVIELRGDEALAVFVSARQALRAAVELQRVFADEVALRPHVPLRVGIGLDAGEAVRVEEGYRGGALNLAARMCAQAGPGEILATQEVVHLARTLDGVHTVDRGEIELKGLDRPVRAILVSDDEEQVPVLAGASTGQLGTAGVRASELPPELDPPTPILGGDELARWLRWSWRTARRAVGRAVFLSGPPGAGKTRLAAEAAAVAAADGGEILYRRCLGVRGELRAVTGTSRGRPILAVVDDLHAASPADLADLAAALDGWDRRGSLLVATFVEEEGPDELHQLVRKRPEDDHRRLRPLGEAEVRAIARLYAGDEADAALPVRAILERSEGLPGAIHELASEWARRQAADRLGDAASRAAAGRQQLRRVEAELAGNVVDLQLARERARLFHDAAPYAQRRDAVPFKGLASFDVEDAEFFFGRERLVAGLVGRLAGSTFLGVVGPSGSGKSSVLRAGLVPALEAGILPGSERWTRVLLRPGEHPLRELDRGLFAALPESLRARMSTSRDPLSAAVEALPAEGTLLIVVDQFEEIFTLCQDDEERTRFADLLVAGTKSGRAVVVIAVRADLYGRCAAHAELAGLLAANHVLVGPMTADEYRRVVEQPARRAGLRIEAPLVEALVAEVVGEPGALPLLSTALLELWQHREGRVIRMRAYADTGGVRGAVARLAEGAFERLSEAEKEVARAIFLRLSAGEGEGALRRRVPLREFDAAAGRVLRILTDARLLTLDEGSVEVAHEALLREWPRLRAWLDEDRAGRRLRQHLTQAAREWAAADHDPGELYRGARLASALDWTTEHTLELNELEREFLSESQAAGERETERQRRMNRRLRILLSGAAVLLVVAVAAGGLAFVQRGEAERAARTAEEQRVAAERAALSAEAQRLGAQALLRNDLDVSLLLAAQAVEVEDSPATRSNLLAALLRSPAAIGVWRPLPGPLVSVHASDDGRWLAIANDRYSVALFDANERRLIRTVPGDAGFFATDGMLFALESDQGRSEPFSLVVYDDTGAPTRRIHLPPSSGFSWAPDLTRIAFVEEEGRATAIQDAATDRRVARIAAPKGSSFLDVTLFRDDHLLGLLHPGPVGEEPSKAHWAWWKLGEPSPRFIFRTQGPAGPGAVSEDLRVLALGHRDGSVTLNDLRSGRSRALAGRHEGRVHGLDFSRDGKTLVTTGDDRVALVWDVATGELRETLAGHNGRVLGAAVTELEGRLTAYTVGGDGTVIAWDLSGERRLGRPFEAGAGSIEEAAAFALTPDGSRVAVAQADGTVVIRDMRSFAVVTELAAMEGGQAADVAFSPDGRLLVVGGAGRDTVTLWDATTWERVPLSAPPGSGAGAQRFATSVAFSPDGRRIAAGVMDFESAHPPRLWLWDPSTGEPEEPMDAPGDINQVTFSPDSKLLAVATAAEGLGLVSVRRLEDRQPLYSVDADSGAGRAQSAAFSPDGRLLVTGGSGEIRFWDAATGNRVGGAIVAGSELVTSLAFDPSGALLVAGGGDGNVRLLDPVRRSQIGPPLPRPGDQRAEAAFTPDGQRIIAVYSGGRGWSWEVALDKWRAHACAVAGRRLSELEWQRFLPDRPYAPACDR